MVGDEKIGPSAVRKTIDRIDAEIVGKHHIDRFRTASEVNREFPTEFEDPYRRGSIVAKFTTDTSDSFVRVHQSGSQVGAFVMRESEIVGLGPQEIQRKFSLPNTLEYVSDVSVPDNTKMYLGGIEANFGGVRGATQFQLVDDIPPANFHNRRELID